MVTTRARRSAGKASLTVAAPPAKRVRTSGAKTKKNAAGGKKKAKKDVPTRVKTKVRLKGTAAPNAAQIGVVDAGLVQKHPELQNADLEVDARLVLVDPSKNMDKYYVLQLINEGTDFHLWQRWGRSGTSGQGLLLEGTRAEMMEKLEEKYAEKTGVNFEDVQNGIVTTPLKGKYQWLNIASAAARKAAAGAKWEYYVDDGVDGKEDGWYPYTDEGAAHVEELFTDFHVAKNNSMAVRVVESGNWFYHVDLSNKKAFTQKNTSTRKVREIRRVVPRGVKRKLKNVEEEEEEETKIKEEEDGDNDEAELHPSCEAVMPSGSSILNGSSATLNQTNIGSNNNKFYIVQAVQTPFNYQVFTKWGRVGEDGQFKITYSGPNAAHAEAEFKKKFQAKTGNRWEDRKEFVKKNGKYDLILTKSSNGKAQASSNSPSGKKNKRSGPASKSKLDTRTQEFIEFIFSNDMFREQMKDLNVDVEKMPLGALSKAQVQSAYEVLEDIEKEINGRKRRNVLSDLSSRYYTVLPHAFGRQRPPVIDNHDMLQKEYDLVNVIGDIEEAQQMKREVENEDDEAEEAKNPIDADFETLNMDYWNVVDPKSDLFKMLKKYAENSKGHCNAKLLNIFEVARGGEGERFQKFDNLKERYLFWHGTNVAVVAAILKSGLRIMPHSGGRVGAGIYLASEHAKSVGYTCPAQWKGKQVGVMFLAEAAVGKCKVIDADDHKLRKAPKGFHSVLAKGNQSPLGTGDVAIEIENREVKIPLGPIKPTSANSRFHQDEILIYDEGQHRLRYVFTFQF